MPASMPSASSPSKPQTFLAPSPTPSRAVSPRTSYTALHHSRVNFSNRVGPASSTTSLCSAVFNLVQDDTIVNSSQLLEPAAFAVAQKAAQTSHSTQEQKRITEYKVRPINVLCKLLRWQWRSLCHDSNYIDLFGSTAKFVFRLRKSSIVRTRHSIGFSRKRTRRSWQAWCGLGLKRYENRCYIHKTCLTCWLRITLRADYTSLIKYLHKNLAPDFV